MVEAIKCLEALDTGLGDLCQRWSSNLACQSSSNIREMIYRLVVRYGSVCRCVVTH
jgi:hypothetical protein